MYVAALEMIDNSISNELSDKRSRFNLDGIDFSHETKVNVDLKKKSLNFAKLKKSRLYGGKFNDSELTYADFSESWLEGVYFERATLDNADMSKATIENCYFTFSASLKNVNL